MTNDDDFFTRDFAQEMREQTEGQRAKSAEQESKANTFGADDINDLLSEAERAQLLASERRRPAEPGDCDGRRVMSSRSFRSSHISTSLPPPLAEEAFDGLSGDIVRTIEPHSEADPAALLIQLLVGFGNLIGRGPYFLAEADKHATNEFVVLVGETAKGRKGSSFGRIKQLLGRVDPQWSERQLAPGLSSGEGLIWAVRDEITKPMDVSKKGEEPHFEEIVVDPGVSDKRLLVYESEFASTLRIMGRDGNTLSPTVREAWDSGNLRTLTKNSPAKATGALISIIGHITKDELRRYLDRTEAGNGFGNRFLWLYVRRSKFLPEGGSLSDADLAPLIDRLKSAVEFARRVQELRRDEEARRIWHGVYNRLSEGKPGLLGAMIARAEAHVMRLACIYALLDRSRKIRRPHLLAALALWDYAEASARYIFGEALGDPVADEILRALRAAPRGLTRTEIRDLFRRNRRRAEIGRALGLLLEAGLARPEREPTDGRPVERWFAATRDTTKTTSTTKAPPSKSGQEV